MKFKLCIASQLRTVCVPAQRNNVEYTSCYNFIHKINPDQVKAEYDNGILTLTLPFEKSIKTRKIQATAKTLRHLGLEHAIGKILLAS